MVNYAAEKYVASSPSQEVIGQLAMSNFQNVLHTEVESLLEKHGLVGLKPDHWYFHQKVLDFYRDIESGQINGSENLVAIGSKGVENIVLPPELQTLDAILEAQHMAYYLNVRPVVEGEGLFPAKKGDGHYQIRMNAPYPPDLMFGFFWALANRYKPPQASFSVHVIDNPNVDTEPGIVFDIQWDPAGQ